ncbi:sushi, von Willebrand factor type A, EGF and pentraxin domain-containing protein 1-like [Sycon ciliatum]|uniref:sushi, von Willebrand factor type A, EGF and pentraxin domain-containing protein 1-like n=1 Tax=Sycon ciliatum TaxID=27933 RepID=UPI0031F6730C
MKTQETVQCRVDGRWSKPIPSCSAVECPVPSTSHFNGNTSLFPRKEYYRYAFRSGAINYECNPGYHIAGQESNVTIMGVKCETSGEWSHKTGDIRCEPISCGRPNITNAVGIEYTNITIGSNATVECMFGYYWSQSTSENTQNATITCQENLQWSEGYCEDYNECANSNHTCHQHANCTNTIGSFSCTCNPGYVGNGHTICNPKLELSSAESISAVVIFGKPDSSSPWNATNIYTNINSSTVIRENEEDEPFALIAYPKETAERKVPTVLFQDVNTSESKWVRDVTETPLNFVTFQPERENVTIHFITLPWKTLETVEGEGIEHRANYRPFQLNCYRKPHIYANCSWDESALNANNSFTASLNQGRPYEFQLFRIHGNSTLDILTGPESNSSNSDDAQRRPRNKRDNSVMDDVIAADGHTLPVPLVVPLAEIHCPVPGQTAGLIVINRGTTVLPGIVVNVECDAGYYITGQSQSTTQKHITCGNGGQWTPSVPSCSPIRCPALPPIYNVESDNITISSNIDHSFKGSTLQITVGRYLDIVNFHCKSEPFPEDYDPRTGLSVECGENGTWSSQNLSCIGGKDV